jgi:Dolichyl-phosphate-mannose-protein mannosyltransferase
VSTTVLPPVRAQPAPAPAPALDEPRADRPGVRDTTAIALLAGCFAVLTALTWRKWGVPEIDAGAELTTADLVKHGALAYRDVRYYYGPLSLYSLALSFKLLGSSFTVAYAFGLAQALAILAAFYALARQWLVPLSAALATAVLMAIGFSGTAFNFVLPHTSSATFGILFLLLMLLALARERLLLAGVAAGLIGLTRPEFVAVAVGALAAYLFATWRLETRTVALARAWRLALPALAIPALVLGWFAARAGLSTLVGENLWPAKFIHVGAKTESDWMPFTVASFFGVLARGAIYGGLLAALVVSVEAARRHRGVRRIAALWPLLAALAAIGLGDALLRASGLLAGQRAAIELEARHLMLGMSFLPALGFAAAALAARRLWRRSDSPLGGSWPVDLALIVAAAALGLRAYNAFTVDGSYAPYYAAPLVLLLGILHAQLAERRPQARIAVHGALGLVAVGLAAYALGGLYVHDTTPVHTPRGTFVTTAAAAPAIQAAVRQIDSLTNPGQRILAAPVDGGLYFMSNRRPALRELSLLPGLIASPAEERAAIARLRRGRVTLAVIGARDFSSWGSRTFGVDYDPLLGQYLHSQALGVETLGTPANPPGGTYPSQGFTVLHLRG